MFYSWNWHNFDSPKNINIYITTHKQPLARIRCFIHQTSPQGHCTWQITHILIMINRKPRVTGHSHTRLLKAAKTLMGSQSVFVKLCYLNFIFIYSLFGGITENVSFLYHVPLSTFDFVLRMLDMWEINMTFMPNSSTMSY